MPNLKSAKKRQRSDARKTEQNLQVKSLVRSCRRKLLEVAEESNGAEAPEAYKSYCSALDRAVKIGVVKKNCATRRKTRAANKVRGLTA